MMAQNFISRIGEPGWMAEFKADAQAARPVPQEIFEHCRVDSERAWQLKQHRSEAIYPGTGVAPVRTRPPWFPRFANGSGGKWLIGLGSAKPKEKIIWGLRQPAVGHG